MIVVIDEELEKSRRSQLTTVEANNLLAEKGLLPTNALEPGRPLRILLCAGKIPHAYQVAGKGSQWVIPHSSVRRTLDKPYTQYPLQPPGPKLEP